MVKAELSNLTTPTTSCGVEIRFARSALKTLATISSTITGAFQPSGPTNVRTLRGTHTNAVQRAANLPQPLLRQCPRRLATATASAAAAAAVAALPRSRAGAGLPALINRHVVALRGPSVDLAWSANTDLWAFLHFFPIGDPTRHATNGEHDSEHVHRDADGAQNDA